MVRVSRLMGTWARSLGLEEPEVDRWRATGLLHDALRDADPEELRDEVYREFVDLPEGLLHAPVAADRIRDEGVEDEELWEAIAFHPLGHPGFQQLGLALYAADFLDPGRSFRVRFRRELRQRMPQEMTGVVVEVARVRICEQLRSGSPLRVETMEFWNRLIREVEGLNGEEDRG